MGRFLLIDHDHDFSALCAALLRQAGHSVVTTGVVPDKIEITTGEPYDLILFDPGADITAGVGAVRARAADTPLLLLSGGFLSRPGVAGGSPTHFPRCRLLAKPFSVGDLLAAIEKALELPVGA